MLYYAAIVAIAWIFFKMLDSVPMLSKPLQLIGLIAVAHFALTNRDTLGPYVQSAASQLKSMIPTPTPVPTQQPAPMTTSPSPNPSAQP